MDLGIKNSVVTASSRGLGRAVAEALAAEGARLAVCARDRDGIAATGRFIKKEYGVDVLYESCDVSRADDVRRFAESVAAEYGTAHILFANAGGPPPGRVGDFAPEDYERAIGLNTMSTIRLVDSFLPLMRKAGWGRIIASASVTVKQPLPALALSNVSRAGVVAYIKTVAREYASTGITANTVAPGYIYTDRVKQILDERVEREGLSFDEAMKRLAASIPAGRIGTTKEFASLVAFLASEQAGYINGETILIDGGQYQGLM